MDDRRKRRSGLPFLVLVVAALIAAVAVLGHLASRPASTSNQARVVLTPVPGTDPTELAQELKDAANVLRLRVAALDTRAKVKVEQGRLIVTAPRSLASQLTQLGSPGQLELRPVLGSTAPIGGCTVLKEVYLGDVEKTTTACSQDGVTRYSLGPARLTGSSVSGAEATSDRVIVIHLTPQGRRQFTQLTRELSTKAAPTNAVAIAIDGIVLSAPEVHGVIVGDTQITGTFTSQQAKALAVTIRYGTLPLAFAITGG